MKEFEGMNDWIRSYLRLNHLFQITCEYLAVPQFAEANCTHHHPSIEKQIPAINNYKPIFIVDFLWISMAFPMNKMLFFAKVRLVGLLIDDQGIHLVQDQDPAWRRGRTIRISWDFNGMYLDLMGF